MSPQFSIRRLMAWTALSAVFLVLAKLALANEFLLIVLGIYAFLLMILLLFAAGTKFRSESGQAVIQAKRERVLLDERTKIEPEERAG